MTTTINRRELFVICAISFVGGGFWGWFITLLVLA
jgi:hypothetical protein